MDTGGQFVKEVEAVYGLSPEQQEDLFFALRP